MTAQPATPRPPASLAPRRRWHPLLWCGAALLLCVPAVAMQFTGEVQWGPEDFLVMGAMLAALCFGAELALRTSTRPAYRLAAALALGGGFLMTWMNLAVGIMGEPGDPANLVFVPVGLLALLGAAIARLRPAAMAHAMGATAALQLLVALYAVWLGSTQGAVISAAFVLLWLAAALLFRHAADPASKRQVRW